MSFTRLDLLTARTDPDETLRRFNADLDLVENLHRFLVTTAPITLEGEIGNFSTGHRPCILQLQQRHRTLKSTPG